MKSRRTRVAVISILLACLAPADTAEAQTQGSLLVRGNIINFPTGETVIVELRPLAQAGGSARELAAADGSFEFHNLDAGTYEARLTTSRGEFLRREIVRVDSVSNRLTIRLPAPRGPSVEGGVISIRRLAFKPSKAARKLHAKAEAASERKRPHDAIALLKRVVELEPGWAEAHNNLGVQYYRLLDLPNAFASFARAWELDPESAETCGNYSLALIHQGRGDEAERIMRRLMQRSGRTAKGQLVLAMALAAQGVKKDEARTLLSSVADQFPSARALLARMR